MIPRSSHPKRARTPALRAGGLSHRSQDETPAPRRNSLAFRRSAESVLRTVGGDGGIDSRAFLTLRKSASLGAVVREPSLGRGSRRRAHRDLPSRRLMFFGVADRCLQELAAVPDDSAVVDARSHILRGSGVL
ncbi:hypothetical protein [Microbacterium sp. 22242]|uniref:hypothetical protein n=1 Tax=Microbacterium sp. 22242 TaxID=3453896 RepID=UPI003F83978D